jgi:hypothetical protein
MFSLCRFKNVKSDVINWFYVFRSTSLDMCVPCYDTERTIHCATSMPFCACMFFFGTCVLGETVLKFLTEVFSVDKLSEH